MGSWLSHIISATDGCTRLPIGGWSTKYSGSCIAHFIGEHALQVLPMALCYLLKDVPEGKLFYKL
jgi:hypothetical protein